MYPISLPRFFALSLGLSAPAVLADFLGPSYPSPVDITSNQSLVAWSWGNITSSLTDILYGNQTPLVGNISKADVQNVTFSLGVFSLHDSVAARSLQFHHTGPEIASSINGTHKVDGDSIYRIASVTKLFTALTGLIELTPIDWERPLSDVLAPLGDYGTNPGVYTTPWDKITLRALAAQIAGVPRDGFPNPGEILLQAATIGLSEADLMAASGLPPYNASDPLEDPPCLLPVLEGRSCPPTTYLEGVVNRAPTFLPWTTPAYSNNGFTLLGLAIANITGKTMEQLYHQDIFSALGMASSNSTAPPPTEWHRSVIVGDPVNGGFSADNGIFVSSGGLFSTTHDLARFGTGILNSTLLPPEQTRRWLKPVSHTARLAYSVGAPWEIIRYTHASGTITDIYAKLGDSGSYSAYIALLPDYGAGFSINAAGTSLHRVEVLAAIAGMVAGNLLPALAAQAAVEAEHNYAGVYTAPPTTGLRSSMTLCVDGSATAPPGLVISEWISNGTDVLPWLARLAGPGPFRLVPSIMDAGAVASRIGGQVAFRLVNTVDAPSADTPARLFTGPGFGSADWIDVDASTYYGVGLSLFVVDVGPDGRAKAISPAAYRIKLVRSV